MTKKEIQCMAWGVVLGAALIGIGGPIYMGWYTKASVDTRIEAGKEEVRLEHRAVACADQFMALPNAVAEMKGAGYNRDAVVRKFVKTDKGEELPYGLASACTTVVAEKMKT